MKKKIFKNIVNLIILFLSMEVLKNFLTGMPELGNLDIRIIFVLIISNYMGMKYGIASAILASISYIIQKCTQVNDINVIFLNTNNWIPIVIYILFSVAVGLKTDKENYNITNLKSQLENKEKKMTEKNEKVEEYEKEIKELNQILMIHNNSYIQVAEFIKKFEKRKCDKEKINRLLKKILQNDSCELTKLEEINKKTNNFIDSNKISIMEKENIWINKKLEKSIPFYIAPIFINETDKLALVVWNCEFEQINTEYRNQIIGVSEIIKYVLLNGGNTQNVI